MTSSPLSICVYCGSREGASAAVRAAARALGAALAERGWRLVYGGGRVGIMGIVADAALAGGGAVTGIIPRFLEDREQGHTELTELIRTGSMHERKQRMFEASDGFLVLPGGIGSLDEMIEVMTWRQLGLHDKPIVVLDLDDYWAPLFGLFDHVIGHGFAPPRIHDLYAAARDVDQALDLLEANATPGAARDADRL